MYEGKNVKHQKQLMEIVKKYKKENPNRFWPLVFDEANEVFEEDTIGETWRTRVRSLDEEYQKTVKSAIHSYEHSHDKEQRLLSYLKEERTMDFLQEMLEMDRLELLGYIMQLQLDGRAINVMGEKVIMAKELVTGRKEVKLYQGELTEFKFCVVTDTHLGNKKQQLTYLHQIYDECVKRGITTVFHAGDITDGLSRRQQHIYELFVFGADEQAEYVIQNYPKREGITTYFITGNHDAWTFQTAGVDVGKIIANNRPDMIYLGNQRARLMFNNVKIDLFHPADGSAYAISYSGQKTIETMSEGDAPHVLFSGHHHKFCSFMFKGVYYNEVPSLEDRTMFEEGKKIMNTMGCMFPVIKTDENGDLVSFTPEVLIFEKGIEMDYIMPDRKQFKKTTIL